MGGGGGGLPERGIQSMNRAVGCSDEQEVYTAYESTLI